MKDKKDLGIVFDVGHAVVINRMYQPVLDGILVTAELLNTHNRQLTISSWDELEFQFKVWNVSANTMNTLWRDLSRALNTIDKHWSVVYIEDMMICSYDIEKEV